MNANVFMSSSLSCLLLMHDTLLVICLTSSYVLLVTLISTNSTLIFEILLHTYLSSSVVLVSVWQSNTDI